MSGTSFSHVLVTRFNSPIGDGSPSPDEQWLRERRNLFRQYALASIRSQSVMPSRWLILCHAESPAWFVDELKVLIDGLGELVFTRQGTSGPMLSKLCCPANTRYLITTRMDNDDCVARDFIESIQAEFREQQLAVINFPRGLQLQDGRVYDRLDPSNAFISLIEDIEGRQPYTVFMDTHDKLGIHAPILQVKSHPMWIQVVHGSNLANVVHGVRANPKSVRDFFAPGIHVDEVNSIALAIRRLATASRLSMRVLARPSRLKNLYRSLIR